jgi:hypothetical protein
MVTGHGHIVRRYQGVLRADLPLPGEAIALR